ncbi:MAG: hypothetical protein HW410_940 [Nitrosarchaeum sp.]|nr:hypothetical protein [Nitrosarchaeum sp.]
MSITNEKSIRRVDLDVLERLLLVLYKNTEEKKTNIARSSKMGYDKCALYLDVLERMEFAKKNTNGKNILYSLTSFGINYSQKIMNDKHQNDKIVFTA